ncbi:MAG: hypothetical protein KA354_00745 [Phycisphaerae bacterium]|nr:hypothetical protein [Phycisphaerae bacterium]
MALDLSSLIRFIISDGKEAQLVRAVDDAARRRSREAGFDNIDHYLDHMQLRGEYRRAVSLTARTVTDIDRLVHFIRRLPVPVEAIFQVSPRLPPWETWEQGSVFAVVVGERQVLIPEVAGDLPQRAVGARDAEALAELVHGLSGFRIECRVELHLLPSELPEERAQARLDDLRKRPEVGAVVVLGSPVVNPMADPIARIMLDNRPSGELPARFRWSIKLPKMPYLSEPLPCAPNEQGIVLKGHGLTTYRRDSAPAIAHAIAKDPHPHKTFDDCSILILDVRTRPLLVLCAGHGGWGTIVAVRALKHQYHIEERIRHSYDPAESILGRSGEGRVFAVTWAKRKKPPSHDKVDDLVLTDDAINQGWGFAF